MHNQPYCDPTPSQADIQMRKTIIHIAKPLGTAVPDHIIVERSGHANPKGCGCWGGRRFGIRRSSSRTESGTASEEWFAKDRTKTLIAPLRRRSVLTVTG
jgi:RadC-like JAB domain